MMVLIIIFTIVSPSCNAASVATKKNNFRAISVIIIKNPIPIRKEPLRKADFFGLLTAVDRY